VEAVGPGVTDIGPGDDVFGTLADAGFGAFAEYVCAPVSAVVPKPGRLTHEEAAAIPGSALAALQGLRDRGGLREGQRVLVNGASGGVGTFAVQIARSFGAEVTGVCSTRNMDLVRSLGAAHVIDYTREDFVSTGRQYDLILDAAAHRPFRRMLPALVRGGAYVFVGGNTGPTVEAMLLGPLASALGGRKVVFFVTSSKREDLLTLRQLVEDGKLSPVIDRRFTLEEAPDAIRHLESGRGFGKSVITGAGKNVMASSSDAL
jgi:NADPH:quinone reductase-like Zn-dependent oxidoreductase